LFTLKFDSATFSKNLNEYNLHSFFEEIQNELLAILILFEKSENNLGLNLTNEVGMEQNITVYLISLCNPSPIAGIGQSFWTHLFFREPYKNTTLKTCP
jgi:hypothetical protein